MHDPGSTGTTDLQSHSLLRKSGTALCSTHEWNHKINVVVRGTIQVLLNTDVGGGGGLACQIFWKKALRRCKVQCY